MKVLKDNFNKIATANGIVVKPRPKKFICENCGSELEYEKSDVHIGAYGASHVLCPLCGYDNMTDDEEYNIALTKNNIEFPTHFHHTSVETGAVDNCTTEFVRDCVKKAIDYFRMNKDEFAFSTGTGTTMVHVFRYTGDEDYEVFVSKDHYHTYINFEPEDYGENEDRFQTFSIAEREW